MEYVFVNLDFSKTLLVSVHPAVLDVSNALMQQHAKAVLLVQPAMEMVLVLVELDLSSLHFLLTYIVNLAAQTVQLVLKFLLTVLHVEQDLIL
jgi:hypothetical protein